MINGKSLLNNYSDEGLTIMKLSIIMPCYNVAGTLIRALDSIVMQEADFEYEILVVDDASTDSTVELAKKYALTHPQVKIICNKSNKGNAYTFYKGLCASAGDYFCVLDGDDYYTIPDKLQRQVDFLDFDTVEEYVGTATHYIIDFGNNMVHISGRSNYKEFTYADFLTPGMAYYHTSTYMYRNIFRGNVPIQFSDILYRGDTPRTMFHLLYSGKKIKVMDFVGSAYTYEFEGIWSGLKHKQQLAYQVSYQTSHKKNVLSDFERASADAIIEFNQKQMEMAEDDYWRPEQVSIEQALKNISDYAEIFAFSQMDFVLQHVYYSAYIDTLCASLGYIDQIRNPEHVQKKAVMQNLCIVNSVLNPQGGGIFSEIKELVEIYQDKNVYLIVTGMEQIPVQVTDIFAKYSNLKILCPPKGCTNRFAWFKERVVHIAPFRTYYYSSHKDAYGAALAQKGCCENITLFSFDHGYLCGISNPNLDHIIAKRPADYWMLVKKFRQKVLYIPAWSEDICDSENRTYDPFAHHTGLITASGAARSYKIDGQPPYRYIDMIVDLLKSTGGVHFHFGDLPDMMQNEIREKLKLKGVAPEQFVHVPWADNLPLALLENHVDVFVEPFPIVSYKLTLQVLSVGIPIIAWKGFTRMSIADFIPRDSMFWKSREEFISVLSNVNKDYLTEQSGKALQYFHKYHSKKIIGQNLRNNIGLLVPEKYFYPDNVLLDITSSLRLFGKNYRISVMDKNVKHQLGLEEKKEENNPKLCPLQNNTNESEKSSKQNYAEEMEKIKRFIVNTTSKILERTTIEHLDYHLTEHCNLNCIGCSTFAPIADKNYASLDSFEKDIKDLYRLVGNTVQQVHLLGGEPLLHPQVEQFAGICRSVFTEARIDITTNGLLVFDMPESFWSTLKKNKIAIKYTQYPIKFDYHRMTEFIKEKGIYVFSAGGKEAIRYFRRIPLNVKGTYNMYNSFIRCPYTDCAQLRDGKLYHCPASAFVDLLNKRMQNESVEQFTLSQGDYLDLSLADSSEEVYKFLSNAIPFCRYCDMENINEYVKWGISKRDIKEWIDL